MNDAERHEALREQHRRLRAAAQAVLDAAAYPTGTDEEAKVYASQLRDLRGEPQPSAFTTMSVSQGDPHDRGHHLPRTPSDPR